ncbi:MAG: Asp-tRNA(Asn)/Glu-tRNA(Gln) amidotransferase subunit GatB, partial [Planctomycetota bacterium]
MPRPTAQDIESVQLIVGMEVHVELSTRSKMFSRAPSPAHAAVGGAEDTPNTLIDPTVLGLPGALPVMNREAVERSIMVGLALGCSIAARTKWDRKSYFYPDMPKAYQISQYDLPLCFDGAIDVPAVDERGNIDLSKEATRIGIIRAHLEEDAGKLMHEAPGGGGGAPIDFSIVDYNRAGTPLLEIVTQPDFRSAEQCVAFGRMLRDICRCLGVTQGVMQRGHMRFEPNINTIITLKDGHLIRTPIVEVKNLNSFKSLKGAVEFELADQPRRWLGDRKEMGKGMKVTRGWDDDRGVTFVQREKEDAHDYRYFPDPDLPPVVVSEEWRERLRAGLPELPHVRLRRYVKQYDLDTKEAAALVEEPGTRELYEAAIEAMVGLAVPASRAGRLAANLLLHRRFKRRYTWRDPAEFVREFEKVLRIKAGKSRFRDMEMAGAVLEWLAGLLNRLRPPLLPAADAARDVVDRILTAEAW